MRELGRQTGRSLAYDWDHPFEFEHSAGSSHESGLNLVMIDDDGQARQLAEKELDRQGLGHIVTTAVIPPQRKPPPEETIPPEKPQPEQAVRESHDMVPDPSIYLG